MATLQEEIGKLIARQLLAGSSVAIPGVGTLRVERQPARRLSATMIQPPCRKLIFLFEEVGPSLRTVIEREAACSAEEAADACERWLEQGRAEQQLYIDGVGVLCGKLFSVDAAFQRKLNPQGVEPVRLKRRMPWWIWSLLAIVIAAFLTGLLVWWINPMAWWNERQNSRIEAVEEAVIQPDTVVVQESVVAEPEVPKPLTDELYRPTEIIPTRSGKSYVVLGIYSTLENARRAVGQAEEAYGLVAGESCIFNYGSKFLVSLGESDKRAHAQEVAARYRTERGVKDVWVYSKN